MPNIIRSHHDIVTSVLLATVLAVGLGPAGMAADSCATSRPDDGVWLVSTRHLHCATGPDTAALDFQRFDGDACWQAADIKDLLNADPATPVVVYVHGNRVGRCEAIAEGWRTYRTLTADGNEEDTPPIQFVIWSWPSDRVRGALNDVRVKARRTDLEAYFLARWLARFDSSHRVALVGHSFGARIIAGGLHLLGGGTLLGRTLPPAPAEPVRPRAVLLAAALHNYWLRPGCRFDMALPSVDRLLNLYNRCDPVLRHYRVLDKCTRAEALGYTGMCTNDLDAARQLVTQQDVRCLVGRNHDVAFYIHNPTVVAQIRKYVLWHPVDLTPAVADVVALPHP